MPLRILVKEQVERLVGKVQDLNDSKQDKLTQGDGIIISNNTISTDGITSSSSLITRTEFEGLD
jgi:hypothetical protein